MSSSPARSLAACTAATWAMLECSSALGKLPLKMQPACITSLSLATGTRCRIGKASKNRASFSFDLTAHPWHDLAKPVGCSESAGEWPEVATRVQGSSPPRGWFPIRASGWGGREAPSLSCHGLGSAPCMYSQGNSPACSGIACGGQG